MSATSDKISELLYSMQSCISDVKAWETANMFKFDDNKTELMLVTSKGTNHLHNLPISITIGNAKIPFKQFVKNLGFTLDSHLTMNAHVSTIDQTCYFGLCQQASIHRFLTSRVIATLVSCFVLSRIEVETVREFTYLGDRVSAGGWCEAAVTARIRCGWFKFMECSELLCGRKFSIRLKGAVYKCYVWPSILYCSEACCLKEREMEIL